MSRTVTVRAAVIVLLFVFLLLPGACSPPSDEDILRQYIDEGVSALNERDRRAALEHVRAGLMIRGEGLAIDARRLMLIYFQRFRNVHVFVHDLEIELADGEAEARFTAILMGSNATLPEHLDVFAVTSRWEKDDDWWLADLTWQRRDELRRLPEAVRRWLEGRDD